MIVGTRVIVDGKEPGVVRGECKTRDGFYRVQRDGFACSYYFHRSRLVPMQARDGRIEITLRVPLDVAVELCVWLKQRTKEDGDAKH